jgi:N-acetylglucosaminyldiphosphoundecaprenol N-acetyl-beta-D-mannosaminyltransferase
MPQHEPSGMNFSRCGQSGLIEGLPISLDRKETVLREIERKISAGEKHGYISITNTESMYHGLRIPEHRQYLHEADMSLCDGVGVIVAGWFWGLSISRFTGPILQLECSRNGVAKGWKHFFYGGKPGVATEMARRLRAAYPGLNISGIYEPPFRDLTAWEDKAVVASINDSGADIVWVGLGLLKQERWIKSHLGSIDVPWMVGVGAAFDYHAGVVPWAPGFVRALGLEWLFRLIIQPRLRAKRYWWSAVFVFQSAFSGLIGLRFLHPLVSRERDPSAASLQEDP